MAVIDVTWGWEFRNISTGKKEHKDNRYNAVWKTMVWQDQVHVEAQLPRSCVSSDVSVRKMFRAAAKCFPQEHRGGRDRLLTKRDTHEMCREAGRLMRDRLYSRTVAKEHVAVGNGCSRRTLERSMRKWKIKIEVKGGRRRILTAAFPDVRSNSLDRSTVREFKPNALRCFDEVERG